MNIVLQSFGKENEYKRALLTIYSLYSHATEETLCKVILFTDSPEFFKSCLPDQFNIKYVQLTKDRIAQMRGEIDFIHRMKISIIEDSIKMTQDKILYLDSDTFFISELTPLYNLISFEVCLMHLNEYKFETLKDMPLPAGKTFQDFYRLISAREFFLKDGTALHGIDKLNSWNAGVIGLHPSHLSLLPDVYLLTDTFYRESDNHASEQYAFSIVLQNKLTILPCQSAIYHYWYRVEKKIMDAWLQNNMNDAWHKQPTESKIMQVKEWTKKFPTYLKNHLHTLQDISIQAFDRNDFAIGFKYASIAFVRKPWDLKFNRDVLYHLRRTMFSSIRK